MQLASILNITGELLQGAGENPTDGATDANAEGSALLPFAAVLSGTLSLLTPEQATPEAGAAQMPVLGEEAGGTHTPDALVRHLEQGQIVPAENTGRVLTPDASSLPAPAAGEALEGIRADAIQKLAASARPQTTEGAVPLDTAQFDTAQFDTAQSTIADEALPPVSSTAASTSERAPAKAALSPTPEVFQGTQSLEDQPAGPAPEASVKEEGAEPTQTPARRAAGRPKTHLDAAHKASATGGPDEPLTRPIVPDPKETTVTAAEPAKAAPEGDAGLLEAEGVTSDKTTESSARTGSKANAAQIDGGDVSADAGGDSEAKGNGTDRSAKSRRARRAEAEHAAPKQTESPASETTRPQQAIAPEIISKSEMIPEDPNTAPDMLADPDPSLAPAEEQVATAASDKSVSDVPAGRARAARGLFQHNRAVPVAWLRAVLSNARQAVSSEDGWKVLEMNLDEGDGTVTIKARREEGRVAIAVGFSDPELRALANTHADRLQEALQAEYETTVDFSLFSGNQHDPGAQHQQGGPSRAVAATAHADADANHDRPARRSLLAGTQHEWVG